MEIDKYLTLDLEGQDLEYVQNEGIEYVDWALQMLLDANPLDEYPNILIEDCIGYIRSLVGMGERLEGKGLSIAFYTKAVKVLSDSSMAYDEQELHDDAYAFAHEYLNASSANYAYMQSIIYDSLMKTFQVDKNSSKEILDVYKEVTIPKYEVIKNITINKEEFTDINKAQEYINQSVVADAEEIYYDSHYFSAEVVLTDNLGVFELMLNITDAYNNDTNIWDTPLLEVLLSLHDYFRDELEDISDELSENDTIELDAYRKDALGTIDFSVLHDVIDINVSRLIGDYNSHDVHSFALKMLSMNYNNDIAILEHIIYEDNDACRAGVVEIFRRYNFGIPHHNGRADYEYIKLYYRLMILKTFAIDNYSMHKDYRYSEDETENRTGRALLFIGNVLDEYTTKERVNEFLPLTKKI